MTSGEIAFLSDKKWNIFILVNYLAAYCPHPYCSWQISWRGWRKQSCIINWEGYISWEWYMSP